MARLRPGVRAGSVLKCPWHGYEYDAASGCALFDRRRRLRPVRVHEHDGWIVAELHGRAPSAARIS